MNTPRKPLKSQEFRKAYAHYRRVLQFDKEFYDRQVYYLFNHLEESKVASFEDINETHIEGFLKAANARHYSNDNLGIEDTAECIQRFLLYLGSTYGVFLEPDSYLLNKEGVNTRLGKHIQKLREQKGWSRSKLARKIGESENTLEAMELGKLKMNLTAIRFISSKLGVSVYEILNF